MKQQGIQTVDQALTGAADELRTTLKNCEDEPIRIPGSIQRHGFLLLLDEEIGTIVAASENAAELLDIPLKLILGSPVETILEREVLAVVQGLSRSHESEGQIRYLGAFPMRKELYSVVTHLVHGQRVLEFEEISRLVSPELMNGVITNFVGKLSRLGSELELCAAITKEVKELTGFNRVLLYSFDKAGHGTVLTEESDGILPTCLDLRFPASDIPEQARALYVSNTVRIIPNALYIPSPLRGAADRPMKTFDLSSSILRSVSPIHLEYMRNMGTMASMSLSLVREGRLWGLISCHHAKPHGVPFIVRSSCDLLTKMVGTQLMAFRKASQLETAIHFHAVQRKFLTQMAAENDYLAVMAARMDELVKVTNAEGAALIIDGQCRLGGKTPGEAVVLRLAEWMDTKPELQMLESSRLGEKIEWASEISEVASGLLMTRISDVRQSYILWFRPEIVNTVKWAGEPIRAHDPDRRLHPRASFEAWQEMVRGQSAPWTEMEIQSAEEFRAAVMTISLKRAEEAVELGEARFQQLTHSIPNLVWAADDEGNLTYVNQRWRERGLGEQGLWYAQAQFSPEDQQKCKELWRVSVLNGTSLEMEIRLHGSVGNFEHWNLVRAVPFWRANDARAGWVGTFTDLTERREREMALRMTEKLALTGRMTSVIAHEINNPLEAITNILYLLGQEVRGNDPASAYVVMAESELERISGITKQTLRWSNESAQKEEVILAGSMFESVLRVFAGKIRNRDIDVAVSGHDTPIFGIVGQLQQVLSNLIANALDAVPVSGRIWLSAVSKENGTEIVVGDDGSGMSEETQRHLFEPFYSTKGDLGNGLGLYISQEIVERHEGQLLIDSSSETGTRMQVRLPHRQT